MGFTSGFSLVFLAKLILLDSFLKSSFLGVLSVLFCVRICQGWYIVGVLPARMGGRILV